VAQDLLNKANWDQDKLLSEYFSDTEAFLKQHALDEKTISSSSDKLSTDTMEEVEEEITCSICFDDFPPAETTKLDECKHLFCNDCWGENLAFQISTGHTIDITCMSQGCTELVPSHVVQKLVPPELCSKYNTFLGRLFVNNSNDFIIWCPAAGCDCALSEPVTEGKIQVLTCVCGNRLCWLCHKEAHPPVLCKAVEQFSQEAADDENLKFMIDNQLDGETLKWMHENTKQCPFCNVSVQKNDGCYMMTCGSCHKQWCWLCRDPWETHPEHFKCNKYNVGQEQLKDKPAYQDDEAYKKRLALQELAKFFQFYHEQAQNITLEDKKENKDNDKEKIKELRSELGSFDISFIPDGRLTIKKCRETLKYSYVHAYFTREQKDHLLDYLQQSLGMCVERLAQTLQKPANQISAPDVRKSTKVALAAWENL